MSSSRTGPHAGAGTSSNAPALTETTYAERVRTLLHLSRIGTLSTHSQRRPGFPFGSVMPYGLDAAGRPIFLISTLAMHTKNLQADPRASLLVTNAESGSDPLAASRVTLVGNVSPVPEPDVAEARKIYLERYPNSKTWVDYEDFSFYRMEVIDVYYVGGFGVMGWVAAEEYYVGKPDPLAEFAPGIIHHMNADHTDALALIARKFAGVEGEEAAMTAVDRLGFYVELKTSGGTRSARVAFIREVENPTEARKVLIEMVAAARQK